MEDLKVLKRKRKEIIKKIEKLRKDLNDVEDRIAEIEGIDKDVEDIREVSEKITKDIKKRPRPDYKENLNINKECEDRISKRQKRIDKEKIVSPETIEDSELEDEQQEIIQKLEMDEDNLGFDFNEEEIIELNGKNQSKKEIEDLLEELSEEELKNLEFESRIKETEITGEIPKLYYKLCKQEGILFEGKRGMMEIYYEFGKKFEEKLNVLLDEYQKEKTAINKIIEEIIRGGINYNRRTILRKSEKARKIYKIINTVGGKEKIRKLKNLNSEEYMKFSLKEIEEWIKNC
jgi:hypothetical protein